MRRERTPLSNRSRAMYARWAATTPAQRKAMTVAAYAASPASLEAWARKVDPGGQLDDADRARLAESERATYFRQLGALRRRRDQNGTTDDAP